jgi:hypothetical protein
MTVEYISDPDVAAHTGFILAEESALKEYVSGLMVPNPRGEGELSEVPVWFRWPESERRMAYPFITIDLLSIDKADERFTSFYNVARSPVTFEGLDGEDDREGIYYPGYSYDVQPSTDEVGLHIDRYAPYNLMFQISTFARSAYHDRFLTSRIITDIFRPKGDFWINVAADHAARRCWLVQWTSGDTMETSEASKRIFRKIYTILMETEIPVSKIEEYQKVSSVHIDLYNKDDGRTEDVDHPVNGTHDIAIGTSTYTV